MTMGLILLGIAALAVMFGFAKNAYKDTMLKDWMLYLIIIAFAVGIIVPTIRLSYMTNVSVGGFILPVLAMIGLLIVLFRRGEVMRGIAGMLIVTALTFGLLLIMPRSTTVQMVLSAMLMGVVLSTFAFIVARSRVASMFAIMGGVTLGDLIFCLVDYFAISGGTFTLGSTLVYNALFLSAILTVCLAEIMLMLARDGRVRRKSNRKADGFEAGRDNDFTDNEPFDDDYFD